MKTAPLLLTEVALARLLKGLAESLGVSPSLSDAVAQVYYSQTGEPIVERWSKFLLNNCTTCAHNPETCAFFAESRNGRVLAIETGVTEVCPLKEPS